MAYRYVSWVALYCAVFWACSDEEFVGPDPSTTSTSVGNGGGGASAQASTTSAQASTGSANGGGGGAPTCQSLNDPCSICAHTSCNAQYCACYPEQDCAALVNCFNGCAGDAACEQNCMTMHPNSIANVLLLGDCVAGACSAPCPGVSAQGPCPECLLTNCPSEMNACLSNPDCTALLQCVYPSCAPDYTTACIGGCLAQYPAGQSQGLAVYSCLNSQCQTPCAQ